MFTLVIGGSASGKSEFAERHALSLSGSEGAFLPSGNVQSENRSSGDLPRGRRIYIAAMQPFGEEAQARIARHHAMRRNRGFDTIERYTDLSGLTVPAGSSVLLEDLGNLVANEMFSREENDSLSGKKHTAAAAVTAGIDHLLRQCAHLTVVTNEVFSGGNDYEGGTGRYLRELALVNKAAAEKADLVIEAVCGIPVEWKAVCESNAGPGAGHELRAENEWKAIRESRAGYEQKTGHTDKTDRTDRTVHKQKAGCSAKEDSNRMIFVTGPLYSGKQKCIMEMLGWSEEDFEKKAVRDVQDLASACARGAGSSAEVMQELAAARAHKTEFSHEALQELADELSRHEVVIASEVGGGVVPVDPRERRSREAAGRLACMLAERADVVIRVLCGQPQILKGKYPAEEHRSGT